jgi:hypothetical protein
MCSEKPGEPLPWVLLAAVLRIIRQDRRTHAHLQLFEGQMAPRAAWHPGLGLVDQRIEPAVIMERDPTAVGEHCELCDANREVVGLVGDPADIVIRQVLSHEVTPRPQPDDLNTHDGTLTPPHAAAVLADRGSCSTVDSSVEGRSPKWWV